MSTSLLAALLAMQAPSAIPSAMPVPMTQEQRALVRCSAAIAVTAGAQAKGEERARQWPELGTRGREFFVRALAQLMDETGLDRDGIASLVDAEAKALVTNGEVDKTMPACLLMLEASGV